MEIVADKATVVSRENGVATLQLNRPEDGNAIDLATSRSLLEAVADLGNDPDARCVLLTGTGRFFCVGGAINAFKAAGPRLPVLIQEITANLHAAMSGLANMAKPLVVAVNGPAAGAGLSLAIIGDIVLSAPRAHFSMAYSGIGFSPDGGATWLLPRVVGLRVAQEMSFTNRRLSAEEAQAVGLITRVVPEEGLLDEARTIAEKLAAGPTRAFGATRQLLNAGASASFEHQMAAEARAICKAAADWEGREGIAAFAEKRSPEFAARRN